MTQDERWMVRYNEVKGFIKTNHRNPSKYYDEEKLMVHILKRNRKLMNHKVTNSDVQHLLVVSKPTATRLLQKLDVLLEQVGYGAGAYYKIRNY